MASVVFPDWMLNAEPTATEVHERIHGRNAVATKATYWEILEYFRNWISGTDPVSLVHVLYGNQLAVELINELSTEEIVVEEIGSDNSIPYAFDSNIEFYDCRCTGLTLDEVANLGRDIGLDLFHQWQGDAGNSWDCYRFIIAPEDEVTRAHLFTFIAQEFVAFDRYKDRGFGIAWNLSSKALFEFLELV